MADSSGRNPQSHCFTEKLKSWLCWSWTYICALWFAMVLTMVYVLRSPLKLQETVNAASVFLNTLTPKFYVALTGTSSLISGLILIFEWWYFRKYGTSFIEQVSVSHLRPLLGGVENSSSAGLFSSVNGDTEPRTNVAECKVWRNPLNLFRGAEYSRYTWVMGKEPLTYYDMNLSAQDHQTFFLGDTQQLRPEDSVMQKAWRERNPQARIQAAYQAIEMNRECAAAYVLLAEEEATTITEAERLFKQALKSAGKDTNLVVYIKRRLAMCARKLGRIKEAVKMMRDLMKEFPLLGMLNIHENLLEALLELQAYADVQAVLAKYDGKLIQLSCYCTFHRRPGRDASILYINCLMFLPSDISLPKSATICYTSALLKARAVSDKFSPEAASRRGLSTAEMNAVEAIHRAVEFNPHVPKYLLEMKSLILPPEHILKRGDSEAVAYAFFHLQHWKRAEGALNLLHCTWEGTFRIIPYPLEKGHLFYPYPGCTETADRELLPSFHEVSVYPKKELPFFILFTAGLCSFCAMLAMLTHQFPELMGVFVKAFFSTLFAPLGFFADKMESFMPSCLWHQLANV
ncbi:suppressor of tumorigenicity 7 protein-like isoform X1 [Sinocyclocheilus anshuiensis]|uniref:suppressor of tumorigenicity 7 protein-like isoform X1 n=1 Tax=Sinocyclocheilus anshuiensis TaxID=1608454 RepID=UPI0007B941A9|nr:PREDICTED: suppressor of tumorigenicity 7 protein-like isoform X1 [Sinocyclocheilus anshuiensis]XP_016312747.1 PREDICTED: suppressor of tumorigenicity 7 protein-like isoform X1 [Sinocyclocheilus anshuiensis]